MARHAGHRLEAMTATGNDYLPSGSAFDPMAIAYLEVSNGAENIAAAPKPQAHRRSA
jgi:hypothetical protein